MFLRFVLLAEDEGSHRKQGILVAAAELLDGDALDAEEHLRVRELRAWFAEHLHSPGVLRREGNDRALSWFRADAEEPIARMWELAHLLRAHGCHVELLKTDDPGVVLYEDAWQVVAKPRRGSRLPW